MIFKLIIIIVTIVSIECRTSYILKGHGWDKEIERCYSNGDGSYDYHFNIGSLQSIGLKYENVDESTSVIAHGHLELYTKSLGTIVKSDMNLRQYDELGVAKKFTETWQHSTTSGWATTTVAITMTVFIREEGTIELTGYVYAGSWLSISCAWSKAYVNMIEIITDKSPEPEKKCDSTKCKIECWVTNLDVSPKDFEGCIPDPKSTVEHICSCRIQKPLMISNRSLENPENKNNTHECNDNECKNHCLSKNTYTSQQDFEGCIFDRRNISARKCSCKTQNEVAFNWFGLLSQWPIKMMLVIVALLVIFIFGWRIKVKLYRS